MKVKGIQIKLGTHIVGLFPMTHAKQALLFLIKMIKNDIKIQVMYALELEFFKSEDANEILNVPISEYIIHDWNCLIRSVDNNSESETITEGHLMGIIEKFDWILRRKILIPNHMVENFASIKIFYDVSKFINDLDEDFPGVKYFNESTADITEIKITDLFIKENNG